MNPYQELSLQARELVVGVDNNGQLCPFCKGGRSGERSLSMHLRDDGICLFICFRASCGKHGRVATNGHCVVSDGAPAQKGFEARQFTGETRLLNSEERGTLWSLYGLNQDDVKRHRLAVCTSEGINFGRLVVPVINLENKVRGHELRVFSGFIADVPKTLHYKQLDEPWIGLFTTHAYDPKRPVVLVEDVISAMKVAHQYVAVSLMGSYITMSDLFEIEKVTDNVILALDRDASAKALAFKTKYRFIAPNLRVLLLQKDLKYATDGEINEFVESCR